MSAVKRTFWRSPSGRIHGMRRCSGGATPRNTKAVTLTPEEFLVLKAADDKSADKALCRCARWDAITTANKETS